MRGRTLALAFQVGDARCWSWLQYSCRLVCRCVKEVFYAWKGLEAPALFTLSYSVHRLPPWNVGDGQAEAGRPEVVGKINGSGRLNAMAGLHESEARDDVVDCGTACTARCTRATGGISSYRARIC